MASPEPASILPPPSLPFNTSMFEEEKTVQKEKKKSEGFDQRHADLFWAEDGEQQEYLKATPSVSDAGSYQEGSGFDFHKNIEANHYETDEESESSKSPDTSHLLNIEPSNWKFVEARKPEYDESFSTNVSYRCFLCT